MIIVDDSNLDFSSNLVTSLKGRGVECALFSSKSDSCSNHSEKIYLSFKPKDYDLKADKELIPFLKSNGFKKAALLVLDSNIFEVEKHLNGAITVMKVPALVGAPKQQVNFFLHYFIEQVVQNIPNLPCGDEQSVKLNSLIRKISTTDATVLVNGPTGTGKEVISNLIHHFSNRREEAFVAVNCAAIPDQMLESMLFGHEKGAFTGAVQPNKGLLRAADKGTVLLDEISEMPIALQAKLLRVIQEKRVMPIGSSQEVEVNVRIIATTNRNMLEEVKLGRFREDLFYRLNVFPLNTLKLSDRKDDIPTIVANMLFNMDIDNEIKTKISLDALNDLEEYHWPGNVRELHNVIQRAKILCLNGEILPSDLIFDSIETGQATNTAEVLAAKFQNTATDEVAL
ncbi:MAG: sigma-54 dependent transcriptional regulator [Paracoccaceae bacterium]|nr:sigma-54 dependent transcriptional regulator [Paracoccaceae bacterium]